MESRVVLSIFGACGGSPPSVFRRDSSSRSRGRLRRETCTSPPTPFPARDARFTQSRILVNGLEAASSSSGCGRSRFCGVARGLPRRLAAPRISRVGEELPREFPAARPAARPSGYFERFLYQPSPAIGSPPWPTEGAALRSGARRFSLGSFGRSALK